MAKGEVNGIRVRGGFVIDFKWSLGKVTSLSVFSLCGGKCSVKVPGCEKRNVFSFEMIQGEVFRKSFNAC